MSRLPFAVGLSCLSLFTIVLVELGQTVWRQNQLVERHVELQDIDSWRRSSEPIEEKFFTDFELNQTIERCERRLSLGFGVDFNPKTNALAKCFYENAVCLLYNEEGNVTAVRTLLRQEAPSIVYLNDVKYLETYYVAHVRVYTLKAPALNCGWAVLHSDLRSEAPKFYQINFPGVVVDSVGRPGRYIEEKTFRWVRGAGSPKPQWRTFTRLVFDQ